MKRVDVMFRGWGEDWLLGVLADDGSSILFEYSAEALRRGIEFSRRHLPLGPQTFGSFPAHLDGLPGLVSDALPDGWGLLLMDRLFRKNGRDPATVSPLDRLCFIGNRAMGALAFEPSDDLDSTADDLSLRQLAQAAHEVVEDRDTPALKALALAGGSPQGARPKVLVQFDARSRSVSTRDDAAGTSWLVKFPALHEHREVCAVEYAYSQLAIDCGLSMPRTELFDVDRQLAAFGVERFDRENGLRVPVHSLAGALHANHRLPSLDYGDVLRATRLFTGDQVEVEAAFARCVFNVVFNNRDDHAKNFSFRMNARKEWKQSPAYDLTFDVGPRGQHQTSVMGEGSLPGRSHLVALARHGGIPAARAMAVVDRTCEQVERLEMRLDSAGVRKATRKAIGGAVALNLARCVATGG